MVGRNNWAGTAKSDSFAPLGYRVPVRELTRVPSVDRQTTNLDIQAVNGNPKGTSGQQDRVVQCS